MQCLMNVNASVNVDSVTRSILKTFKIDLDESGSILQKYLNWKMFNIDLDYSISILKTLGQGSYLTTFGIWWIGFILKITKKGPGGQVKHAALICAYIQYRSWVLKIDPEGLQDRFWVLQDVSWLKGTIWKMVNIDLEYSISILKTLRIDPAEQDLSG